MGGYFCFAFFSHHDGTKIFRQSPLFDSNDLDPSYKSRVEKDFLSGVKVGTLFFGCLSMFIFLVAPASLKSFVLFGDLRLKGFMNDPNYFAYLQTCGYCIWYLRPFKGKWKNLIAFMGYTFCILLSASKTGVVAFLVINLLFLIQKLFRKNINVKHLVMTIMTASVLIIGTHFLLLIM